MKSSLSPLAHSHRLIWLLALGTLYLGCGRTGFDQDSPKEIIDNDDGPIATGLQFSIVPAEQTRSVSPFSIQVVAVDKAGDIATNYSGTASITLQNAGPASVVGTTKIDFVAGVASADDLMIDLPGSDYVLQVSNETLTANITPAFEVKGQPRWVDSLAGDDANTPCGDPAAPCATVNTAIAAAACWDTVHLHGANVHTGPVTIQRRCTKGEELVVKAWPDTGIPEILSSSGYGLRVSDSDYVTIEGLRLTSQTFNGLEITRVTGGVVRNCIIDNAGSSGILIGSSTDILFENNIAGNAANRVISTSGNAGFVNIIGNQFHNNELLIDGSTAVTTIANNRLTSASIQLRSSGAIVRNNIFDNPVVGIRLRASDALIENNTFYGNASDGIRADAAGSGNKIRNNIFADIGGYGINDFINNNEPEVLYNAFFNNTSGACNNLDAGKCDQGVNGNLLDADPLFVDLTNFYLQSTAGRYPFSGAHTDPADSPMIDAGDPSSDFANEPAANGNRVNLGAWGNTSRASRSAP